MAVSERREQMPGGPRPRSGDAQDSAVIALRVDRVGRASLERLVRAALGSSPTAMTLRPLFERTTTGVVRAVVLFEATSTIPNLKNAFDALKPILPILMGTNLQERLVAHGMTVTLRIDVAVHFMPVGVPLLDDEVRSLLDELQCPIEIAAWGDGSPGRTALTQA